MSAWEPERMHTTLTGWGRSTRSVAEVVPVTDTEEVSELVRSAPQRGILARGMGRSYGDAASNGGGIVIDTAALNDVAVDGTTVRVGAGVVLADLIDELLRRGLFVPVTPGTSQVSIAGLVATDVHGKNHHIDGSWGHHVTAIDIVDGTGALRTLTPNGDDPDDFWATVAGMGLTGVITSVTFTAIEVPSAHMRVTTTPFRDLDDLMHAMREADRGARYSVAWIDSVGLTGPLGRGILSTAEHAEAPQHGAHAAPKSRTRPSIPDIVPSSVLSRLSVGAFNEMWWRVSGRPRTDAIESISSYFHPLDGVADWNRIYGPAGMVQYQFVVPDDASEVVDIALRRLRDANAPSFLTVLKRFGPGNRAPLSFPMPGWTLALDLPAGNPRLPATLADLDSIVLDAGGRHYLAKDAHMTVDAVRRGYPRLGEWRMVRDRMDPHGVFHSDLDRRVALRESRLPAPADR